MLKIKTIVSGQIQVNCYIVYDADTKAAVIIDPGEEGDKITSEIEKDGLKPEMLINTHGHFDHILSDDQIRKHFNIPLAAHTESVPILLDPQKNASVFFGFPVSIKKPDILLADNQVVELPWTKFKVIHTPGHTKDSICLLFDDFLITGDTLFAGDIGRTDLADGSYGQIIQSLQKIKQLSPSLTIYPGHEESSTLDFELKNNKYLR
ncbi:MAG: MBL fold metallo-hydrolase [Elusimicrobiota bacterium]|jgi:glyoxylase-like metal-dependent hydrolase (beta-lactamase superfamily II)|nr:MBL fold metallo-hydrolase [Elusimicrobiota bacterium]